jgi:hypothetical protein
MAQQLTTTRDHTPSAQQSGATELWVLVIEQQGRLNHSLVGRLQQRMRVDAAREPVVPYALAFEGVFDAIIPSSTASGPP